MRKWITSCAFCVIFVGLFGLWALPSLAQQPPLGQSRIQGQPVINTPQPRAGVGDLTDFREEMRTLIQRISEYAQTLNPRFAVVPNGGLELLEKVDPVDDRKVFPARGFMRTIRALVVQSPSHGFTKPDEKTPKEVQDEKLRLIKLAQANDIKILSMDFATKPATVRAAISFARKNKFAPFVAHRFPDALTSLPPFPTRPPNENPKSILTIADAQNFVYISDGSAMGRQDEFALKMHDTNFDMVVVDVFHGRQPLSRQAVETLKYKKLGARRMVLARMDIGTAANYRYYWQENWRPGAPSWVRGPYPNDPDRFFVEYWRQGWQGLMYGNPDSFVFGAYRQGYDGVLLEGIDAYKFFESDGEDLVGFR